jgi:hypothetical protein
MVTRNDALVLFPMTWEMAPAKDQSELYFVLQDSIKVEEARPLRTEVRRDLSWNVDSLLGCPSQVWSVVPQEEKEKVRLEGLKQTSSEERENSLSNGTAAPITEVRRGQGEIDGLGGGGRVIGHEYRSSWGSRC